MNLFSLVEKVRSRAGGGGGEGGNRRYLLVTGYCAREIKISLGCIMPKNIHAMA